jgi:DNA/RNA endonuclease G (NUC1)
MQKFARPLFVLALLCLGITGSRAQGTPTVFINEIHYDNTGADTGEFVEIAGPAGTNLTGYQILLYNGAGGAVYDTKNLTGTIPDQMNGFGTVAVATVGIQNGAPDGIALVRSGTVLQFLTYEGTFVAVGGAANGMSGQNIGVIEDGNGPVGESLRLAGTGTGYSDFAWQASAVASPGAVNQGQTFTPPGDAAPSVISTTPLANALNVPVNSTIVINFNESVNATASAFSLSCGSGQTFSQSVSPAASFTLTPSANLPFSAHCTVGVTAAQITDTDASDPPDEMAADFTFSFDTAGAVDDAPAVISTSPTNGATDVDPSGNIVVNFSEQVTATTDAFAIQCGSAVAFGQTSGASTSFVLDPNLNLPPGTLCDVTMTAAEVSDVDGNPPDHPAADYSFSFTTATPPPTNVVINEVDADTPGAGFDLAEFVELYDGGVGNTPLEGLTVVFYNGDGDVAYAAFDLDGYATDSNGYFTLGNPGVPGVDVTFEPGDFGFLQNGPDAVALVAGNASSFPNGTPLTTANVIDAVVYDTDDPDDTGLLPLLNPGQPQVNENGGGNGPNQSIGRCDNGTGGLRNTSTYVAGAPSPDGPNNCPVPRNSPVVISQFYGSGGNAGALYRNDYVELYNRSGAPVDVTGWSLQYAAATGSGWDFNKTPLGGPIGPGEYYLVALAGGATGSPLPPANTTGPINMSGTSGKIAIVDSFDALLGDCPLSNPHLLDLVGYGAANCGEGGTRAPALSASTADFRLNGGATDTDRNFEDFVSGAANPRRTAPIVELGPFLVGSDPSANATTVPRDPTLVFTFTEPVTVVGHWFDLICATTGVHDNYSLAGSGPFVDVTLNVDLLAGEVCTITIFKDQVHDQDTDDSAPGTDTLPGNYSWSFTVASGTPPPYPPSVHLTFGNPTNASPDLAQPENYLMEKPEYALSYNRDLGRPNWVSWHLSPEWYGTLTRVDTFRADPRVPDEPDWYRVQGFDFALSGFDRGHMVPNADRDKETSVPINQATYLMTNMVAQAPGNNQGPWAEFEAYLRTLADDGNDLFIVAGPEGEGGYGSSDPRVLTKKIANNHVTVPANTWKAVLVWPRERAGHPREPISCTTRMIAVIMPNDDSIRTDHWDQKIEGEYTYLTSVDAVEALTEYDLFANLPDAVEYCVEAGVNGDNPPADIDSPVVQCGAADGVWHGNNVTIACTASDGESGLSNPADASFTLMTSVGSGDGNANAVTDSRLVCDAVGNCATAGPIAGNMIDRKGPAIALTTPVDGGVYQFKKTVLAAFGCSDGGSGLATCTGTVASGAAIDTSSMGTKSFVVTASDALGNTSSTTVSYTVEKGKIKP